MYIIIFVKYVTVYEIKFNMCYINCLLLEITWASNKLSDSHSFYNDCPNILFSKF